MSTYNAVLKSTISNAQENCTITITKCGNVQNNPGTNIQWNGGPAVKQFIDIPYQLDYNKSVLVETEYDWIGRAAESANQPVSNLELKIECTTPKGKKVSGTCAIGASCTPSGFIERPDYLIASVIQQGQDTQSVNVDVPDGVVYIDGPLFKFHDLTFSGNQNNTGIEIWNLSVEFWTSVFKMALFEE
ncbi:hypothetical protein BKI52_01465 [marine bacterium AO1-C]|nr:hypothetical protein BKI52_01465 [marine bacterium AO1-C]